MAPLSLSETQNMATSPDDPAFDSSMTWLENNTRFGKLNQGLSEEKMASVMKAGEEKKANLAQIQENERALGELSYEEAMSAFGPNGIPAWREARDADVNRIQAMGVTKTPVGAAVDVAASFGRSATNLAGSAAVMAMDSSPATKLIETALQTPGWRESDDPYIRAKGMQGEALVRASRKVRGEAVEAVRGGLNAADDTMRSWMTDTAQAAEEQFEIEQYEDQAQNAGEYVGRPIRREMANFADSVGNVFSNPEFFANQAVGETATFALGVPARGAAAVTAARGIATRIAKAEGIDIAEAAAKYAADPSKYAKLATEVTERHAKAHMAGLVGYTEASGAKQDTYTAVMDTPFETLQRESEDYRELLADGLSPEEARRQLANTAGNVAFGVTAPLAVAAGRVAAPFELAPLSSSARAGSSAAARLISNIGNIMGETVEETVQGAGSTFGSNVGQRAVGRNVDLLEGTGAGAGTGAAIAAGMSGALQAPSAAGNALAAGAQAAVENVVASQTAQKAQRQAAAVVAPAPVKEALAAVQTAPEGAPSVTPAAAAAFQGQAEEAAQSAPIEQAVVDTLPDDVKQRVAVSGEQVAQATGNQELSPPERLQAQIEQYEAVLQSLPKDADPNARVMLQSMVASRVMQLRRFSDALTQDLDSGAIPEEQQGPIAGMRDWINERAFGERATAAVNNFSKELLESGQLERLQDVIERPDAPESEKIAAFEVIQQGLMHAAGQIRPEVVKQLMQRKDLRPWVRASLERIQKAQADEQIHQEELTAALPSGKRTAEEVRKQILEGGWGKNRRSLKQYQTDLEGALISGNTRVFNDSMEKLRKFAENQVQRFNLIDAAAVKARKDGLSQIEVHGTKTLDDTGRTTTDKPFLLRMNSEGSLANIPAWRADAMAIARLYNQYSQFGNGELAPISVPKGKSGLGTPSNVESSKNSSSPNTSPAAKPAASQQSGSSAAKNSSPPIEKEKKVEPATRPDQSGSTAPASTSGSETNPPSAPAQQEIRFVFQPDEVADIEFDEALEDVRPERRAKFEERRESFKPQKDAVTGLHGRGVFRDTLDRVHEDSGNVPYVYVEADLRNLAGLNAVLGNSGADPVLREAGQLIQNTLAQKFGKDNIVTFRKGGDEFGVIVRNATQEEVDSAMQEAVDSFEAYATKQNLQDTPHTKGGIPGTGIYFASAPIHPDIEIGDTIREADLAVEAIKKEVASGTGTREEVEAGRTEARAEEVEDQAGAAPVEEEPGVGNVAREEEGDAAEQVEEPERELSDDKQKAAMQKRFPALRDMPGEFGTNKLLDGFTLDPRSTNIVAKLGLGSLAQLQAAFEGGLEAVQELAGDKNLFFTDEELTRLAAIMKSFPQVITTKLNDALHDEKIGNGTIADRVAAWDTDVSNDKVPVGGIEDKMGIWATNIGTGEELAYDPAVAEAMSMSAFQFILHNYLAPSPNGDSYIGGFLGKPADAVTDQEKQVFSLGFQPKAMIDSMANLIRMNLGIMGKSNVSATVTEGLPRMLAADLLNVLDSLNMFTEYRVGLEEQEDGSKSLVPYNEKLHKGAGKSTVFRGFKREEGNLGDRIYRAFHGARNDLAKLIDPNSTPGWNIGKPNNNTETKTRGTGQKLSKKQKKALDNLNKIPFYLNKNYLDSLLAMGKDEYLSTQGWLPEETIDEMNVYSQDVHKGINQGLERSWEGMLEMQRQLERESERTGTAVTEIPVFFDWYSTTNGRLMMDNSLGPQSNKLIRELVTPNRTKISLDNPVLVRDALLAIAQGLGIKTENMTHDASIAKLDQLLTAPLDTMVKKDQDEAIKYRAVLDAIVRGENEDLPLLLVEAGIKTSRAFHALQLMAAIRTAEPGTEIEAYLPYELDGKTDGPVNAIGQFGMWNPSMSVIENMRRGGYFVNDRQETGKPSTINELTTKMGDLYQHVATRTKEALKAMVQNHPITTSYAKASRGMMAVLGRVKITEDEVLFLRSLTKHPVTATSYAGGVTAIVGEQAAAIEAAFSETISQYLLDPENPAKLVELQKQASYIQQLTGSSLAYSEKMDKYFVDPNSKVPFEFAYTKKALQGFRLSPKQISNLKQNLKHTMSGKIKSAIDAEIGSTITGMSLVVESTKMMATIMVEAFSKEYERLRQQRIAEGTLNKYQALSKGDENQVLRSLRMFNPILQTAYTSEEESREFGIGIAEKSNRGTFQLPDRDTPVEVSGLTNGRWKSNIPTAQIADPGVRGAALFNIGIGDANMMVQMFQDTMIRALNVFDGFETTIGQIDEMGYRINKAVNDGWMFNALEQVANNFNQALPDMLAFIGEEGEVSEQLVSMAAQLKEVAARNQAAKEVAANSRYSNDHMAGAMNPFTNDGTFYEQDEDFITAMSDAADAAANVTQADPADTKADEFLSDPAREGPDVDVASLVQFLDKVQWDTPVQKYLWKIIKPLIPSNLEVVQASSMRDLSGEFYKRYPGNEFDASVPGIFAGRTIFWGNSSIETILHELVHATTYGRVNQAYTNTKNNLTAAQKQAVANLEQLARSFAAEDFGALPWSVQEPTRVAQQVIKDYLDAGDPAAAINELQAYTTNKGVQQGMTRLLPKKLREIIDGFVASVRKLLGIENKSAESYLSQVLTNTQILVAGQKPEALPDSGMALQQKLPGSGALTDDRLDRLGTRLDEVITSSLSASTELTANNAATQMVAAATLAAFTNAGFYFSPKAMYAFERMQTVFGMGLSHNSRAMNAAQLMYESAIKKLTPESFLRDPENPTIKEREDAQKKFDAVMGRGTSRMLQQNRSNLLANFLALALTNEHFREVLDTLPTPKKEDLSGDFNSRVEILAGQVFDWIGEVGLGIDTGASLRTSLDRLEKHLFEIEDRNQTRKDNPLDLAATWATNQVSGMGKAAHSLLDRRIAAQKGQAISVADKVVNTVLAAAQALESDSQAGAMAEASLSMLNESNMYKPLRKLFTEMIGTQDSNRGINNLVNSARQATSHIRQRLREVLPKQVRKAFQTELPKEVWSSAVRSIGQVDAQSLLGPYTVEEIVGLYDDTRLRQTELAGLRDQLSDYPRSKTWLPHVERLARYLATGVIPDGETLAYRNAEAIALLLGTGNQPSMTAEEVTNAAALLDQLITLQAIDMLPPSDRVYAVQMLRDPKGGRYVLTYLQSLRDREKRKDYGDVALNGWKGFIPTSSDPRKRLVLVEQSKVEHMKTMGFEEAGPYQGDKADIGKYVYMSTKVGSQPTFNQGALQTTRSSYMGLDMVGGYTLDGRTGGLINDRDVVSNIIARKKNLGPSKGVQLMPLYNNSGKIVGFERPIDQKLRQEYTKDIHDLAESIAMWEGRIQEEAQAIEHNQVVADQLKDSYDRLRNTSSAKEFIDISNSKDPVIQDAWDTLPPQTRKYLKAVFSGGAVMVRKDMVDNAMGYRSASVTDMWNDRGDWSEHQKLVFRSMMGPSAYKYLHTLEHGWQGFIGTAKETIVVKSLVVGWSNLKANQLQLLLSGVNPIQGWKWQAQAMSEVNTYLANERKLAEIHADLSASNDPKEKERLRRLKRSLQDANDRMMIAPLIKAGELPSIAEDLAETDHYSIVGDFTGWLEKQVNELPSGVVTAAKWAVVAKDTPLYRGMNRFIQYGDFTAKVALYQHLLSKGMSQEDALKQINEEFVNYSLLPGRHRTYLESMGMTWFANYKIRIQKILLRHIRNNPLRVLMISGGAALAGMEHLFEAVPWNINYSYLLGPEPVWSAHESIVWNQLMN